ncbi:hypothetical protein J1N35_035691 [Gossypium stocksii]|uniref:phosphoribosylaminoimidazolesuccinocarboxamide synthase n=1 Tax=Gossypium stocksii TaxID=47602 RepID=A0A9D3UUR4_9ROSI|nr:hypothetical protein J1N35_035691 [Gossypium stocksii]
MVAILKKPKMLILTPVNSSKNLAQTLLFPSIYSFTAKPKSINYPNVSFSVICSQSQQKYPPFDSLLNSYRKEEVRDIYDGGGYLVLVTTDRQSAFDRILAPIPFKGQHYRKIEWRRAKIGRSFIYWLFWNSPSKPTTYQCRHGRIIQLSVSLALQS